MTKLFKVHYFHYDQIKVKQKSNCKNPNIKEKHLIKIFVRKSELKIIYDKYSLQNKILMLIFIKQFVLKIIMKYFNFLYCSFVTN